MARQLTLKSFNVRLFRNIVDSGEVRVDDVTCLVGKNEAGKSALLQALHHLNPAKPDVTLSLLDEYPRWLKKEHEITGEIKGVVPIRATFVVSDDLKASLAEKFGDGVVTSGEIEFFRTYDKPDTLQVKVDINFGGFIDPIIEAATQRLKTALGDIGTTDQLAKKLAELIAKKDDGTEKAVAIAGDAEDVQARLKERLAGKSNLTAAVNAELTAHLPETFYFSSYSQLEGRYHLDEAFAGVKNGTDDESLEAAADFLRLARVVPETVEDWDFERGGAR